MNTRTDLNKAVADDNNRIMETEIKRIIKRDKLLYQKVSTQYPNTYNSKNSSTYL